MPDIYSLIEENISQAISHILKCEVNSPPSPELSSLLSADLDDVQSIVFDINGDINGEIAFVFENGNTTGRRFLEITVGCLNAAETDESCQEISNQALGRLLGALSENNIDIEISYPGEILPHGKLPPEKENCKIVSTVDTTDFGKIYVCSFLRNKQSDPKEEPKGQNTETETTRVLIVDDSPVMCAFLENIFLSNGYEVVGKASDGLEAIKLFEETSPDLVTLDIVMPKMKGTDVLKTIIDKYPDANIVMATSVSDARTVMKCLKMGAKRYIIKPYDKDSVLAAVEKALGIHGDK